MKVLEENTDLFIIMDRKNLSKILSKGRNKTNKIDSFTKYSF